MIEAVGVIADIVRSRDLADRASAQQAITEAFAEAQTEVEPIRSAWATVGDEFQLITDTWQDALRLTLRVWAALPEDVLLRFGIGAGQINTIEAGEAGPIQDGAAWLHARAAIEDVEHRQQRREETLSAFRCDDGELNTAVTAHLVLRDHIVSRMKARERRLFRHLLFGATQQEAARTESISQAAVSQALHRSGAMALLDADEMLAAEPNNVKEGR